MRLNQNGFKCVQILMLVLILLSGPSFANIFDEKLDASNSGVIVFRLVDFNYSMGSVQGANELSQFKFDIVNLRPVGSKPGQVGRRFSIRAIQHPEYANSDTLLFSQRIPAGKYYIENFKRYNSSDTLYIALDLGTLAAAVVGTVVINEVSRIEGEVKVDRLSAKNLGQFEVGAGEVSDLGAIIIGAQLPGGQQGLVLRDDTSTFSEEVESFILDWDRFDVRKAPWLEASGGKELKKHVSEIRNTHQKFNTYFQRSDDSIIFLSKLGLTYSLSPEGDFDYVEAFDTDGGLTAFAESGKHYAVGGEFGSVFLIENKRHIDLSLPSFYHVESLNFSGENQLEAVVRSKFDVSIWRTKLGDKANWTRVAIYNYTDKWQYPADSTLSRASCADTIAVSILDLPHTKLSGSSCSGFTRIDGVNVDYQRKLIHIVKYVSGPNWGEGGKVDVFKFDPITWLVEKVKSKTSKMKDIFAAGSIDVGEYKDDFKRGGRKFYISNEEKGSFNQGGRDT